MRTRFAGLLASAGAVAAGLAMTASASAATTAVTTLTQTAAPAATSTPSAGAVSAGAQMSFEIDLALSDPAGAATFAESVSDPSSASYRQYLTPAEWEARFSPTSAAVHQVKHFLKSEGFTVSGVSADSMAVSASGSAAKVEQAFGTQLSYHQVAGHKVILNDTDLSVPTAIAPLIAGVDGISQTIATPDDTTGASPVAGTSTPTASPGVKPPVGFRNARPCSAYYGEQLAAAFPKLAGGYPNDPPYAPCGYTPPQLRSAYNLTGADNGTGATVAIIDAYAAPTLYADASQYASINDASNPLRIGQFNEMVAPKFDDGKACQGQAGWWGEQTLDVEAVHAMAPGANILYAGAENCENGLNDMLRKIVDGHLAEIVSNSYSDEGGDALDSPGDRAATDEILQMAAATGVSVLYSSGDSGDDYIDLGTTEADYPASSPWATAVGGTTLQIGASGLRLAENGWSTGRSVFCNNDYEAAGGCTRQQLQTWLPLSYDYGGGGGTSVTYIQPYYQAGVVPARYSERNGSTPMRVEPDVAMDADPTTGMLVGETQTFGDGVYYDQYRIGGTSLASPLLAGTVADADGASGSSAGFLNPTLYSLAGNANALDDITPPAHPEDIIRSDYVNDVDASNGIYYSARTINFAGPESFCPTSKCSSQTVTLTTSPGFDNMTGVGSPGAGFVAALAH